MIPKQPLTVRFGAVDTKKAPRHTVLGTLTEAKNVRQPKLGRFQKRWGYSALDRTADSGSITTGQGLAATSDALVMHGSDIAWVRDATNTTWKHRGTVTRAMPTDRLGIDQIGNYPHQVTFGSKVYCFAVGTDQYAYRVFDKDTNVELQPKTVVSASGITRVRAVGSSQYVWFFYQTSTTSLTLAKFDPSTPTVAPTTTTYANKSAGAGDQFHWDAMYASAQGGVYVMTWWNTAVTLTGGVGSEKLWMSSINQATGAANSWVPIATGVADTVNLPGPCAFVQWTTANSKVYFVLWNAVATGDVILAEVTTLLASYSALGTASASRYDSSINRAITGCIEGATLYVIFCDAADLGTTNTEASYEAAEITVWQYTLAGGFTFTGNEIPGAWIASVPFTIGSTAYFVTGYDDLDNDQRAYHLRAVASPQTIIQTALFGRGGKVFMRGTSSPATTAVLTAGSATNVDVAGNHAYMSLQQTNGDDLYSSRWVDWHFADTYGPLKPFLNSKHVLFPGGKRISPADASSQDLVPLAFPPTPALSVSAAATTLTTGTYSVVHTYAWFDNFGNIYRSGAFKSASIAVTATNQLTSLIPPLRHTNLESGRAFLETWVQTPSSTTFRLYSRTANNPLTLGRVTVQISADPATGAEELYTTGGVLDNYPAPSFRYAFEWRRRLFVGGTEFEGEVWYTKEYATEVGPEFAAPLKVLCGASVGRDYAGGEISHDYAAILKADAIFVIGGDGPDDTGNGNYSPTVLGYKVGSTNPNSTVTYPGGLLYQGVDGGIHRIDPGLGCSYVGQGVDDHKTATIMAAVHDHVKRQVLFWTSTDKILVFDYGSADDMRAIGMSAGATPVPAGFWYTHESSDLGTGAGACMFDDTIHWMQDDGYVRKEVADQYYDGTNVSILPKCTLAPLQLGDIGGLAKISRVQFVGKFVAAHSLRMTVTPDGGTAQTYSKTVTATPETFECRPSGCGHVGELVVSVEETGSGVNEGFYFDGLALEVQLKGKTRRLNNAQRL